MSEAAENIEPVEQDAVVETSSEPAADAQPAPRQSTEDYTPYVDLAGIPDETREAIEGRFKHLSRLIKKTETRSERELAEWRQTAAEQSRLIEELTGGLGGVVNHIQQERIASTEMMLQQRMQSAWESGDTKNYVEAQNQLMDLKVQQRLAQQEKPEQKTQTQKQAFAGVPVSGQKFAEEAYNDGDLEPQEHALVQAWSSEKNESGQPLRPWTASRNPENPTSDPLYRRALIEMAAVFDESSPYSQLPMEKKLEELDRRMGVQKSAPQQSVLGANLTTRGKSTKMSLSPKQQEIATRTRFAGPGKSEAEHIEAYRRQLETVRKGTKR